MRICLILAGAALWASAGARADGLAGSSADRATTVVRADPRSGRLVRRVVVPSRAVRSRVVSPAPAKGPARGPASAASGGSQVREAIEQAARQHNVDPLLVQSVAQVESGYNPHAISHRGAEGVMQLMPSTARRLGVRNSFDVRQNIEAGVRHLKRLQERFGDDRLALAAYNAGEEAVARRGGIPPYPETWHYVYQVGKKYGELRRARPQSAPEPAPAPSEYRPVESHLDGEGRLILRTR